VEGQIDNLYLPIPGVDAARSLVLMAASFLLTKKLSTPINNNQKKKLAIEPIEAEIVIRVFDLARNRDGSSGPRGTKKIAERLNGRGDCFGERNSNRWLER